MRTIKLKSLSLVNFKGIRSLNIGFSDAETLVAGENGTGKTTVFDSSFGFFLEKTVRDGRIVISTLKRWIRTASLFCTLNTPLLVYYQWMARR